MTVRFYSSTSQPTTLALNAPAAATSIVVVALVGYPTSFPYTLCLDFDTGLRELVEVTNAAGTTLTVTRGVDGTSAIDHSAGATVRHVSSARDYADSRAHENASMGVHGVAGDLVGTTDTQILSNKTLDNPNVTNGLAVTGGLTVADGTDLESLVVTNNITASGLLSASNFTNPTTFVPGWQTDTGTAPSIGNGTISMEYIRMGNTLFYWLSFRAGATTTFGSGGNWVFQLPPLGTYSFTHSGGTGWARPNNSDGTSVPLGAVPGSYSPSGAGIRPLTIGGQVDGNAVPGTGFVDSTSPSAWTTAGQFFLQGFVKFTP